MSIEDKAISIKLATIIVIAATVFSGALWYSSITNRITVLESKEITYVKEHTDLIAKTNSNDIALAQIKTSLANIETTLAEVKSKLYK